MRHVASILALLCISLSSCSHKGVDDDRPCHYVPAVMHDGDADWAPDGSKIVFHSGGPASEPNDWGIYLYSVADSSATLLIPRLLAFNFEFSPDGQWIAFSASRNIYRISVSGDSIEQLTFSTDIFAPSWSPDGKRIAFHVSAGDDRGIYLMDLTGGDARRIYPYADNPCWFMNGEQLAVISFNFQSGPEIATIDTAGNLIRRLTDNESKKYSLDVSPNGEQICFSQQFECEWPQLWIINSDGTDLRRLTERGGDQPAFSPDGEWIVYTYLGDNNGYLWIMRTDGTEKRQITFPRISRK